MAGKAGAPVVDNATAIVGMSEYVASEYQKWLESAPGIANLQESYLRISCLLMDGAQSLLVDDGEMYEHTLHDVMLCCMQVLHALRMSRVKP